MSEKLERNLMLLVAIGAAFIVMFFIPAVTAHAAEVAAETGVPIPWWAQILIGLSGTIGAGLLALLGKVLAMLFDWLAMKAKFARLAVVDDHLMTGIGHVWQVAVKAAKEAATDGKLTTGEKERFKAQVLAALKLELGIQFLSKTMDGFSGEALDQALGRRLEARLQDFKRAERVTEDKSGNPTLAA